MLLKLGGGRAALPAALLTAAALWLAVPATIALASFVGILWSLSGSFGFSLGGQNYVIPGFMVWMAVLYCVAGSAISFWVGRPLMRLNYRQQRLEADFRHRMVRVREHSEAIALDGGEGSVRKTMLSIAEDFGVKI